MIAAALTCCEADFSRTQQPGKPDRPAPHPELIEAGENLLAGNLDEKDLVVLLDHTGSTMEGFELGEVQFEDSSTLLYHVNSGEKHVWGYTVIDARKIRWADCPRPGNCSRGPGETFTEHFFKVSLE